MQHMFYAKKDFALAVTKLSSYMYYCSVKKPMKVPIKSNPST